MIELRGITWDHPRGFAPLLASIEPYAAQTGIRIVWEKRSLKEFGDTPVDKLAAEYDLLIIDHPHVGIAAATRSLLPLDTCIPADVMALMAEQSAGPSHTSYFYLGHQWALAIDAAMQTSSYRPDLLGRALPGSWEEVLELAESLEGSGRWIGTTLIPTDCACYFLTLCASLGDPPGQRDELVSKRIGTRALELISQLSRLSHPYSLNWNPIKLLDHMSREDDVVYCPLTFNYSNYARDGYAKHAVRFGNIPGVKGSILGGTGFAVSASCQHQEAACAYGTWLCSAETQRGFYLKNGGQPGNLVAWEDPQVNRLTANFFLDTIDTLQHAYLRPRHDGFVDFQVGAGNIIHQMLSDGLAVNGCLDQLFDLYAETRAVEEAR